MIINQAALQQAYVGFKTVYQQAFEATTPNHTKIATVIPSSAKSEEYKWLGQVPRMREWIGDRAIQNLGAFSYTIKNKDFELTIGVDRNDFEDDSLGIYRPLMQSMGHAAAMHPDELVFPLLHDGFTEKCYDGKPFFATNHKDGKGPEQSNKGTKVLSHESYEAARSQMMSLKGDQGKSLKIVPNLLVVPPQLEGAAKRILKAERMENGADNINRNSAELHVEPELAAHPTEWFLLDTSKPIRPLVFQQRKPPVFVSKTEAKDDAVFFEKTFIYGVDSRDNAGYGLWQLAFGSTGAESE